MTTSNENPKTGVLLLNMGGPDCLENVRPFLYNLFSDPDIIRLPFSNILQKPLAWWISTNREEEAKKNYAQMGGASPLLSYSQQQGEALKQVLAKQGHDISIYIAMRYWHPFTEATVTEILRDGIQKLIVLPLYPHFSYTTTGSSLNELKRVLTGKQAPLDIAVIPSYFNQEGYLQAVAETMREALDQNEWSCTQEEVQLLFGAHSLPLKHIKRTGDPYPDQIYETCQRISETYFPNNPWDLSYQSQVGKMPWLGPSTEGALHYFAGKNVNNILMIPISFVSEHVETLVEIDKLYLPLAKELQITHCHRAGALNMRPTFIQTLADLVLKQLQSSQPESKIPDFKDLIAAKTRTAQ